MTAKLPLSGLLSILLTIPALGQEPSLHELFQQRLELRSHAQQGQANQTKLQIMEIRGREDVLAEKAAGNTHRPVEEKSPTAFGNASDVLMNPTYTELKFQSGDVLLLRGSTTISAAIATMSDSPSQFSHSLIVYQDPTTKELFGVEALLDQGVVINPLAKILSEGVHRMVLYRHSNSTLAASAARVAFDLASQAIAQGKNYPYDFKLNMNDYSQLYCAELIRMAYDVASDGAVKIPKFPSTLGKKFANTLRSMGLGDFPGQIYAPSDIDVEKSFELVAEWRDPHATLNFRIKDQVLLKLSQWVEEGSLEFDYSKISNAIKQNQPQPSPDGPKNAIDLAKLKVFADKADLVMNQITQQILVINDQRLAATGMNMSNTEIQATLESMKSSIPAQRVLRTAGFRPRKIGSCKETFLVF